MSIRKELNLARFEHITEKQVYMMGDLIFLVGHIIYLCIFRLFNITPMEYYNYFSVIFYAVMLLILQKIKKTNGLVLIAMAEIVVHSCLSVYFMGWNVGFAQFLIYIIPIPFFQPLKKKRYPYLFSAMDLAIFCFMKIYMTTHIAPYTFTNERVTTFFYLLNSFFGFIVIIYISSIYLFQREINQHKQRTQNEALKKLATIDPLTQLFNRRAMTDYLEMIVERSVKVNKGYVVGLADIDDFKKANDTYGHEIGDKVLKKISKTIVSNVPSEGYVCRWGGEEILFAIPSYTMDEGIECAEKIRTAVSDLKLLSRENKIFSVTITIGVYEASPGENIEAAIHEADQRMYNGKRSGKNCVVYK